VDAWLQRLQAADPGGAWDLFIERYRRLIFATIRHIAQDYDDVMDVFVRVCEALREDDLSRLRRWAEEPTHKARFSTWLVAVVRNLTIDWIRHRDGRKRLSAVADTLPPLRRQIFELVFHRGRSHVEAYELIRSGEMSDLPFGEFLRELAITYRAVGQGSRGTLLRELGGNPPPVDLGNTAEPPPASTDTAERLADALGALDPEARTAVQLFVVDELPAADVARIVGWPNSKAVYNRVYRALAAMRAEFERQGIGPGDL
jgi:DNA-directed RNA polymerase specialized sigma24 family protein